MKLKLYDYYRSTASYRVRIALHLKQLSYETIRVHLLNDGGDQHRPEYLQLNPQALVPTLEDQGSILTQSLAIIEYLDEIAPEPPLLPKKAVARATVRSLAQLVACDIHPLNNLRVLNYLKAQFDADEDQRNRWYHHWLGKGFQALENRLAEQPRTLPVCYGETVSLADLCLIPQVFNAKRFGFDLNSFPLITAINNYCLKQAAFYETAPDAVVP